MKNKIICLGLVLIGIVPAIAQTSLELKLKKGETYKQSSTSRVDMQQTIAGQQMDIAITISGTIAFQVKGEDVEGYQMDAWYETLAMTMESPQGKMDVSSESANENDYMSRTFAAIKNQPFQVVMMKNGKVKEVRTADLMWDRALDTFEELTDEQKAQIRAQIVRSHGDDAIRGSIESVTAIFPDKPVKQGDQWRVQTNMDSGMKALLTTDYTFMGLEKDHALINGSATIESVNDGTYQESNGMEMRFDMKGTQTSEIKIDRKSGWITDALIKQELKGAAHFKPNAQIPDGFTMPMVMKSESNVKGN